MNNETLKLLNQKPVAYYPIYRHLTGSATGGILLSQLMYWFSACQSNKFYKTDQEIRSETALSESELRTAKCKVKQLTFITIRLEGVPAKTYYEIDWHAYKSSLDKSSKLDCINPPNKFVGIHQACLSKSPKLLQENTQENTHNHSTSNDDVISPKAQPTSPIDDDLKKLFNEMLKHKCTFKSPEILIANARKFFLDVADDEIVKALIQCWKFYKPNPAWNTGAWIFQEFFPRAYSQLTKQRAAEKRFAESRKKEEKKRQTEQAQARIDYDLCEQIYKEFEALPEDKKLNWVNEFNKLHCGSGIYTAKVEYRNKTILPVITKFDTSAFKTYLHENLR